MKPTLIQVNQARRSRGEDPIDEEEYEQLMGGVWLDFTGRDPKEQLSPFELALLVNGVRNLDRYEQVTIEAHRSICSQIKLVTRWAGNADARRNIVTLIELP